MPLCLRVFGLAICISASAVVASAQTPELDFSVVNLPTTRPLKQFQSNFHLTHRFLTNLRAGSLADNASNIFGLDSGAVVGLEYRFAFSNAFQFAIHRTTADKTLQFSAKFDTVQQSDTLPVSVSFIASVAGNQNFGWIESESHSHVDGAHEHKEPSLTAVVSRTFGERAAVYAVPMFVHNSLKNEDDSHRDTFALGFGTRVQVRDSMFLVAEVTPRLAGYTPGRAEFGFGIEKRAGGHTFQLTFSNSTGTTFGQIARGGLPTTMYLGFNLGRKFL